MAQAPLAAPTSAAPAAAFAPRGRGLESLPMQARPHFQRDSEIQWRDRGGGWDGSSFNALTSLIYTGMKNIGTESNEREPPPPPPAQEIQASQAIQFDPSFAGVVPPPESHSTMDRRMDPSTGQIEGGAIRFPRTVPEIGAMKAPPEETLPRLFKGAPGLEKPRLTHFQPKDSEVKDSSMDLAAKVPDVGTAPPEGIPPSLFKGAPGLEKPRLTHLQPKDSEVKDSSMDLAAKVPDVGTAPPEGIPPSLFKGAPGLEKPRLTRLQPKDSEVKDSSMDLAAKVPDVGAAPPEGIPPSLFKGAPGLEKPRLTRLQPKDSEVKDSSMDLAAKIPDVGTAPPEGIPPSLFKGAPGLEKPRLTHLQPKDSEVKDSSVDLAAKIPDVGAMKAPPEETPPPLFRGDPGRFTHLQPEDSEVKDSSMDLAAKAWQQLHCKGSPDVPPQQIQPSVPKKDLSSEIFCEPEASEAAKMAKPAEPKEPSMERLETSLSGTSQELMTLRSDGLNTDVSQKNSSADDLTAVVGDAHLGKQLVEKSQTLEEPVFSIPDLLRVGIAMRGMGATWAQDLEMLVGWGRICMILSSRLVMKLKGKNEPKDRSSQ